MNELLIFQCCWPSSEYGFLDWEYQEYMYYPGTNRFVKMPFFSSLIKNAALIEEGFGQRRFYRAARPPEQITEEKAKELALLASTKRIRYLVEEEEAIREIVYSLCAQAEEAINTHNIRLARRALRQAWNLLEEEEQKRSKQWLQQ